MQTLRFSFLVSGFWLAVLTVLPAQAQKFGYVDSQYILTKLPAYGTAQQELNRMSGTWQKEGEQKRKEIEKLQQAYQAEEVLLTDEMKAKRKAELTKKETEAREFQQKTFGFEGTVFKKRQELMKPVQDQVFAAIEKVAKAKLLQIVFDKSGDLTMLYTNPAHDYTDYVLEELGIKPVDQNSPGKGDPGAANQRVSLPGQDEGKGGSGNQEAPNPNFTPSGPGGMPMPPGGKP